MSNIRYLHFRGGLQLHGDSTSEFEKGKDARGLIRKAQFPHSLLHSFTPSPTRFFYKVILKSDNMPSIRVANNPFDSHGAHGNTSTPRYPDFICKVLNISIEDLTLENEISSELENNELTKFRFDTELEAGDLARDLVHQAHFVSQRGMQLGAVSKRAETWNLIERIRSLVKTKMVVNTPLALSQSSEITLEYVVRTFQLALFHHPAAAVATKLRLLKIQQRRLGLGSNYER